MAQRSEFRARMLAAQAEAARAGGVSIELAPLAVERTATAREGSAVTSAPAVTAAPASQPPAPPLAGMAAEIAVERFAPAWLVHERLDDYLQRAAAGDAQADFHVSRLLDGFRADPERVPLELCEYLAYKAVLAYEDDIAIGTHFERSGWPGIVPQSYQFFEVEASDTQGYGYVAGDVAFISMRGTTSVTDWMNDLTNDLTTDDGVSELDRAVMGPAEPRRHLGFARAWGHARTQIDAWLDKAYHAYGARRVCLTGHSLGGALALIGAHDIARRGLLPVGAVITFAAPKVGGPEFVANYDALGLSAVTLRCESPEDLVTWGSIHRDFAHPGAACLIDKRPMIAGMEVFWAMLLGIAGWGQVKKSEPDKTPADESKKPADTAPNRDGKEGGTTGADKPHEPGSTPAPSGKGPAAVGLGAIVAVVVAVLVILAGRRIIIRYRAHGAAKRYTLFFSTHAYRRIRAVRCGDIAAATDEQLAAAAADLSRHLDHIRGRDRDVACFKVLQNRPILVTSKAEVARYLALTRDSEGERGGYWRYIW